MKAIPTAEQREFAATLRGLLAAESPVSLVRALTSPGADRSTPTLWKALADAGVFGLAIAEEYGGSGGSLDDLAVFYTEAGRALCPTTVHSTVQAALAIDQLGSPDVKAAWLPPLANGNVRGTTALVERPRRRRRLGRAAGRFRLDAVAAQRNRGLRRRRRRRRPHRGFGRRSRTHAGLRRRRSRDRRDHGTAAPWRAGTGRSRVRFDDVTVAGDAILDGGDHAGIAEPALRRVANTAVALGSLDLVGIGQAVLDRTVEYTKLRHQFGRPIASFQAAQHLIANMHIALAAARLAAHSAVFWIARGHTATRETAIARMHAATAARLITLDAHQLHGGMGYVTETDLHLWSERARLGSTLGGGADVAASWLEETTKTGERR